MIAPELSMHQKQDAGPSFLTCTQGAANPDKTQNCTSALESARAPHRGVPVRSPERVAVLLNKVARGNRKRPLRTDALSSLLQGRASFFVTQQVREVPEAVRAALDLAPDLIVVSGGDGTLHLLMTELLHQAQGQAVPPLLVLRGGTMNIAAGNLASGKAPARELATLGRAIDINAFEQGLVSIRNVAPLCVQSTRFDVPKYAFVFANGIAYRILREYYASGEPSPARAFTVTASILGAAFVGEEAERRFFPSLEARVFVDGELASDQPLRISVATPLSRLILWFAPFEEARAPLTDSFNFLANFMRTGEIARHFWPLCRGTYIGPGHVCRAAREVTIVDGEGFTLDGEVYEGSDQVHISVGPVLSFVDLSPMYEGQRKFRWLTGSN